MAQDGRGRLHMTDNEQIVSDLIWSQVDKPENHIFTIAHNVFEDRYRVNAFCRTWMGEDRDLPGQVIGYSALVRYDAGSHEMTIMGQTGDVDHKQMLKDSVAKSGVHTFTAREETTADEANFSLKK
jgi:hypothetical protein